MLIVGLVSEAAGGCTGVDAVPTGGSDSCLDSKLLLECLFSKLLCWDRAEVDSPEESPGDAAVFESFCRRKKSRQVLRLQS